MGIFAQWRDKCAPIRFLVKAQKTPWYPVLFALLCIIGGTHNYTVYIPIMWTLALFVVFSALFTDDNKVFLVPLLMIFFSIGCDTSSDAFAGSNGDMLAFMDDRALTHIIILGTVAVGSFLARLAFDGSIAEAFKRRRLFTWSIVAMDVAFLANGLFSPTYDIVNLGYGALMAMGFTVVYFFVSGMLEKSEDPIPYACYTMVATSYVALIQILPAVVKGLVAGDLILPLNQILQLNKDKLTLGWGISNVIGAVLILGIPAAMYLAKNKHLSMFFFASSILFCVGTVMIGVRSAMLVGFLALVLCTIACCIKGKNRIYIRIYTFSAIALLGLALIIIDQTVVPLSTLHEQISEILRLDLNKDSGRKDLWAEGIKDFLSSPFAGTGFNDGGYPEEIKRNNIFSNMYHCIFVEIPGAMGLVGCIAFLIHLAHLGIACFKRISLDKLLLLLLPLMIIGMSLVDNFFFYLNFQIFYGTFLALAEMQTSRDLK